LDINAVNQSVSNIARQVREHGKTLAIYYIVHHHGQQMEALGMAGSQITGHPAADSALHLLTKKRNNEESGLLGIAVARQNIFFGLASREAVLALCALNVDQYDDIKELKRHAWHMAWHAMDAAEYHNAMTERGVNDVTIRRRNALEILSANLRADIFSALMSAMENDFDAIKKVGIRRGINALQTVSAQSPEHFPYVIAMESAGIAMQQLRQKTIHRKDHIETALRLTRDIGKTFDEMSLKQWLAFSEPAQDMAWRGYSREQILSAAINTSEDTYVRATGYLVSEVTGIKPASILEIKDNYSPFADDQFNSKLHEKVIDDIFEDVIARGLSLKSLEPFFDTANQQNKHLLEGQMMGWCAAALQASGQAFEQALNNGREAESAARREFMNERHKTNWDSLKDIGKKIIKQYRKGEGVAFKDLIEICKGDGALGSIKKSLEFTLQSPEFAPQLSVAHTPRMQAPSPRAPSLAPTTPAMVRAPALGMGGHNNRVVRTTTTTTPPPTDKTDDASGKTGSA